MAEDKSPLEGKIRVKIVSPTHIVVDREVDSVQIPACLGVRTIIPKQAPLICALNAGQVVLEKEEKAVATYTITEGVCEVRRDICAIMAWVKEI